MSATKCVDQRRKVRARYKAAESLFRQGSSIPLGDDSPLSHHDDAITQVEHLVEAVGNVNDAGSVSRQGTKDGKQELDLGLSQVRRGLVEYDQPWTSQ